ncbi:MAG TPA: OmpA family protein [Sphingomicrobium sp.]|nr:OmpA family protein [Sphingomicrobium sp.]
MLNRRTCAAILICGSVTALAACQTAPPPPPPVIPVDFRPLGLSAPYLSGDVIGGTRARATRLRSAGIRPLGAAAVPAYMMNLESELRRQTAGIGLDVLRVGEAIVVRIPAALTFDAGSSTVKPQFDATLLEIARTVKTRRQTFVDVFAHTDTTGTVAGNQALSDRRAAAVATYLSNHGVARARIASRGLGQTSPLYVPDDTETKRAANRRVEIRLVPYRG